MRYYLTIHLRSDTTFGRGEGVAGAVDIEIEHDQYGCPYVRGRTLKGLLAEEWVNLRFGLAQAGHSGWDEPATILFGQAGATLDDEAALRVGDATLPPDLCAAIRAEPNALLRRESVLHSLTALRRQTSVDASTGAPETGSLRVMRVLLRETPLIAQLDLDRGDDQLSRRALGLLAACALGVRRGGVARNRGRGRLALLLHEGVQAGDQEHIPDDYLDDRFTRTCFEQFVSEVRQ